MSLHRHDVLRIQPPNEPVTQELGPPSLREIRDAVRGKTTDLSRASAVELLAASDYPNKHRDLQLLLEDVSAPPRLRYLAAMSLPRSDHRAAHEILIAATRFHDSRVLTGVMRALGQIGGRDALEAIAKALPNTEGTARTQAQFAATLIAHRLGLEGHAAPEPRSSDILDMAADAGARVRIRQALSAEVERSLVSLGARPYGIELAEYPMYEFRCDRCTGMIMLNREFTDIGALAVLQKRKALFAIGTLRQSMLGTYSPAALFLTAPTAAADRIRISVHLTNGDQVFVGEGAVRDGVARWSLRAVRRLGAFPIHAEGEFEEGQLDISSAASATRILQKARPAPIDLRSVADAAQQKQRA
jgi:hypothetical protein